MDRAEAISVLNNFKIVGMRSGKTQLVQAIYMAIAALREQDATDTNVGHKNEGCEYCNEDRYGYRKMLGAFSIYNPFHGYEYYLNCGKAKPRKINYCPVCGRKLGGAKG